MFVIDPLVNNFDYYIQQIIDNKTKPLGALGALEDLAFQLAKIQLTKAFSDNTIEISSRNISHFLLAINHPNLLVFAGDHGVASQGVSIAPSDVTSQMVENFAQGGAAINIFCRQLGWQLSVIDTGTLIQSENALVINQRLGHITQAINHAPAMSIEQVGQGFIFANQVVNRVINKGCNVLAFGEMGIGNTTIASAIMAAIMKIPVSEAVGKGTGVSDDVVLRKQHVVEEALALHADSLDDPLLLLACLGGYEVVQMTGAMLAAAEKKITIVVDGFICTAAAMVAIRINPNVKAYMVFAHCSGEQGHEKMLTWLGVKPLLQLGLRLGEGTGAALLLPYLQASSHFYNDMATFQQADVTDVVS